MPKYSPYQHRLEAVMIQPATYSAARALYEHQYKPGGLPWAACVDDLLAAGLKARQASASETNHSSDAENEG